MSRSSLILVTVDCLRADHCGFYGYSRPTTPFLDSLAAESFVVPTAVVAGAPTYYSFPALLASRMPLALGRDVVGLAPGESTIATALQEEDYATAAFTAANPYLCPHFGYDQGFEIFEDFLDFEASPPLNPVGTSAELSARSKLNRTLKRIARAAGLGRLYDDLYFQYCMRIATARVESIDALRRFPDASIVIDRAIAWLASAERRPFFLWLHLMDPHSPYYPAAAAFREFTGREVLPGRACYLNEFWNRSDLGPARLEPKKHLILELYDAGIRSVDGHIARLIAHLRQNGRWENCAFVLTADHGEEFLEHGRRYHAPVSSDEEVVRVPLMIRIPGTEKKKVTNSPFSHLHLAPTLLEALDVPAPDSFQGRSLWCALQQGAPWNDPALAECAFACTNPFRMETRLASRLISVRDAHHKLVLRLEPGALEDLYELKADGKEKPLAALAEMEVRVRFLRAAHKHLSEQRSAMNTMARLRARLRELRVELGHSRPKVS